MRGKLWAGLRDLEKLRCAAVVVAVLLSLLVSVLVLLSLGQMQRPRDQADVDSGGASRRASGASGLMARRPVVGGAPQLTGDTERGLGRLHLSELTEHDEKA